MPKYKLVHRIADCIGCGTCEVLCPEIFKMGDDQKSHLKGGKQEGEDEILGLDDAEKVKEIIDSCPVSCIELKKIEE